MRSRLTAAPFALLLVTAPAFSQAPAAPPAQPGPAPVAPGTPAAAPAAPSAQTAPKSQAFGALDEKLHAMRNGAGLTAEQAAARSMQNSAQLEAKARSIDAARANEDQAKSGYWPRLTLSASYTRLSPLDPPSLGSFGGGGGGLVVTQDPTPREIAPGETLFAVPAPSFSFPVVLDNYQLAARLSVPISDYVLRVSQSVGSASHARRAAELDAAATKLSVGRDARVAYYRWIQAQAAELIAAQSLEQAKGHETDANNAFQAGLVSKADVLRTQAQVKNAELFVIRTKNARDMAELALAVSMRDSGPRGYAVGEDVFAEAPDLAQLPPAEAAYREALSKRVELKVLSENQTALREQARVARAANYPRLDAQANALYANPNPRVFPQEEKFEATWDVGVVLSWTPTDIPGAQAQTASAEARAKELEASRTALADALRLEVTQALTSADEARHAIQVSSHVLAAAEEGYRVRRELFRAGRATLVEVTDAETELTRARIDLVNAHVGARIALAELRHALGRDAGALK
jgi:outer membrane protein TolC